MYEVRLKIDKVVDVSSIIRKVVYERLGIEVNSFYKKKIETPEKDLYIYIFGLFHLYMENILIVHVNFLH